MSKIKIKSIIKGKNLEEEIINVKGIKKDNSIICFNKNYQIHLKISDDIIELIKEDKEKIINLEFSLDKNKITKCFIKDLDLEIILKTITKKILIKESSLLIEYDLFVNDEYSDSFIYKLEWSEI